MALHITSVNNHTPRIIRKDTRQMQPKINKISCEFKAGESSIKVYRGNIMRQYKVTWKRWMLIKNTKLSIRDIISQEGKYYKLTIERDCNLK